MIHVLAADDHPLIRCGLRHVLGLEPDFAPLEEAADSSELLRKIAERSWDIVLLDISMPGRNGLECLAEIRKLKPQLPVLILSIHSEQQYAVRAIRAGANGYFIKGDPASELIAGIKKVLGGRRYVSPSMAEALAQAVEEGSQGSPHESLSERELQVICRIAQGASVSDIAKEIALSVKTVSTYRARALEKMGMRSNAELTRYAIRNGLVD